MQRFLVEKSVIFPVIFPGAWAMQRLVDCFFTSNILSSSEDNDIVSISTVHEFTVLSVLVALSASFSNCVKFVDEYFAKSFTRIV